VREGDEVRGGWLAQQRGKSWMWLAALAPAAVIGIAMTRRTGMQQRRAA
jgi:hypothetical protein